MSDTALEKLLENSGGSVYKLVNLASKRALEITEGQPKLVDTNSTTKPTVTALKEIAEGKVRYKKKSSDK